MVSLFGHVCLTCFLPIEDVCGRDCRCRCEKQRKSNIEGWCYHVKISLLGKQQTEQQPFDITYNQQKRNSWDVEEWRQMTGEVVRLTSTNVKISENSSLSPPIFSCETCVTHSKAATAVNVKKLLISVPRDSWRRTGKSVDWISTIILSGKEKLATFRDGAPRNCVSIFMALQSRRSRIFIGEIDISTFEAGRASPYFTPHVWRKVKNTFWKHPREVSVIFCALQMKVEHERKKNSETFLSFLMPEKKGEPWFRSYMTPRSVYCVHTRNLSIPLPNRRVVSKNRNFYYT